MTELAKGRSLAAAARAAGMCENTARRYRDLERLPSERPTRSWRTRKDPFYPEDWQWVLDMLTRPSGNRLQSKALFQAMRRREGVVGDYADGQLRSFQRKVKKWRAQHGPDKDVSFAQQHRPGEALQTDWTQCDVLAVTLAGEAFPHKLCHSTLPYSNWRSARICRSESFVSLKDGVQAALRKLGRHPEYHQTDQSSTATHNKLGGRVFNEGYLQFVEHHGMKARTIGVKRPEQNGDVEAGNRALKSALEQQLILRGSRDFSTPAAYQKFVDGVIAEMNAGKEARLKTEMEVMTPVTAAWAPTFKRVDARVGSQSTIRVDQNTYSVPSRLIGERVRVRVYDPYIEVWFSGVMEMRMERLQGRCKARINYRHVISSLRRKPGAFERYRYREEMFPRPVFRRCFDALCEGESKRRTDIAYLDILYLAARTSEEDVAVALELLLDSGDQPSRDAIEALVGKEEHRAPAMEAYVPDLTSYDGLLGGVL